jgi:iron complex outermembrane receptor protein
LRSAVIAALLTALPFPAHAQRANENVILSAEDAYGHSLGSESFGIYSESDVRGFNPRSAGNIRLEGLYFDTQGTMNSRLVRGSRIRVGPAAQAYLFPSPTGIVDYELRPAGSERIMSSVASAGPYDTRSIEFDLQSGVGAEHAAIAAGFRAEHQEIFPGDTAEILNFAIAPRISSTDTFYIRPF